MLGGGGKHEGGRWARWLYGRGCAWPGVGDEGGRGAGGVSASEALGSGEPAEVLVREAVGVTDGVAFGSLATEVAELHLGAAREGGAGAALRHPHQPPRRLPQHAEGVAEHALIRMGVTCKTSVYARCGVSGGKPSESQMGASTGGQMGFGQQVPL